MIAGIGCILDNIAVSCTTPSALVILVLKTLALFSVLIVVV